MDIKMDWTEETYRLDEIERKFKLPCVVHVNEGYYSQTDAEGFSQGDIMSIDSKMVLYKVAANFADHLDVDDKTNSSNKDYVELKNEILVPLNYKGKLKVLRPIKYFEVVRELAGEFPRYAKVIENLKVTTEENVPITINAGTIIELDRIFPGSTHGNNKEPDKLVIQFQQPSGTLPVSVPFDTKGKFRTEPDNTEYTVKEVIDRFSLPQHVSFVDDEIKRIYTQNLLEGIENMCTVTETLRLNRLVTQNVLVGHYKPLEGSEKKDTGRFRQRTLVVLPLDNREICEIEVKVLKEESDDVYEQIFLVRNVSNSNSGDIVDGSLYVDFAMMSGIKIISQDDETSCDDKPPPRPPKCKKLPPAVAPKPKTKGVQQKMTDQKLDGNKSATNNENAAADAAADDDDDGNYEIPETVIGPNKPTKSSEESPTGLQSQTPQYSYAGMTTPSPTCKQFCSCFTQGWLGVLRINPNLNARVRSYVNSSPEEYSGFSLADMDFTGQESGKSSTLGKKSKRFMSNIKSTFKGLKVSKEKYSSKSVDDSSSSSDNVTKKGKRRVSLPASDDVEEETPGLYTDIDESKMVDDVFTPPKTSPKTRIKPDRGGTYLRTVKYNDDKKPKKPTALVQPSYVSHPNSRKLFKDLNNKELVERLNYCGLKELANFCEKNILNGSFFQNLTSETLREEMKLKGIELAKLIQMRDENWVPT